MAVEGSRTLHFFDLPDIVREKILGYLTFEELAHLRIVCRSFDAINQMLLNKGFRQVERYQAKCLKEVKSQLPRRESERRNHPLFRHCDILTAIETRLSLLNMTFMKYVDNEMCCFIPGKVIDEIYRVLHFIQSHKTLPCSHEILTELRDISSMAMEHFEEKIVCSLKRPALSPSTPRFSLKTAFATHSSQPGTSAASTSLSKSHSLPTSSEDLSDLANSNKYYKLYIGAMKKEFFDMKSKVNELRRKMSEQEKVALEQNRIISEQAIKLTKQEGKLAEVNRKLAEYDQRMNEVLGGAANTRDKQSGSSSSTSNKWGREDSSQQFYVTHGLPTPAMSPAVFVPANIIQPNLVNLAAASMSARAYLPSSPMTGFSGASSGQESSSMLSQTINSSARFSASHCIQGALASCCTTPSETTSQVDNNSVRGSTASSEEGCTDNLQCKKRTKRKFLDEDENNDSHSKQAKL
ncbi:hypothetical protein O3P69_003385 [Scylla paramamosain]|uniref:F-box domain-containing protein n=1 Tax=Scylla paramamosain TaxID=85552 RepID=A0AAW0UGF4_SCYPA